MNPEFLARVLLRLARQRIEQLKKSVDYERLQKAAVTRSWFVEAMKPWGWTPTSVGRGGSHHFRMVHSDPRFRPIPLNQETFEGHAFINKYLNEGGLKLLHDGRVVPNKTQTESYPTYTWYKQGGHLPDPLEGHELEGMPSLKTWRPPVQGLKYLRVGDVKPGDIEDPKAVNSFLTHLKSNKDPNLLPHLNVYQFDSEGTEIATPDAHNSSLLAAAKKAGMTHVPAAIEHLWTPSGIKPSEE